MSRSTLEAVRRPAPRAPDQADGLRRLFEAPPPQWLPLLLPRPGAPSRATALAQLAHAFAGIGLDTLVVDAARALVAAALGLRLRFDLQHALDGDCLPGEARADACESLWVLPAARALDCACEPRGDRHKFAAGVAALACDMNQVILLLPPARAGLLGTIAQYAGAAAVPAAWIPVGPEDAAGVLPAVGQALADAEIRTFRLLFLGMNEEHAATLLEGLAATAQRRFGATLRAGAVVPDPQAMNRFVAGPAGGRAAGPVATAARQAAAVPVRAAAPVEIVP